MDTGIKDFQKNSRKLNYSERMRVIRAIDDIADQ